MTALSIEDRLALQDLIAAYSWALDTGDADGLVACFTEACEMRRDVPPARRAGRVTSTRPSRQARRWAADTTMSTASSTVSTSVLTTRS